MNRCHDLWRELRSQDDAALTCDAERRSENGLSRSRSEADEHLWFHETQLRFHPWPASRYLTRVWFLVNAPLAARLPLEVFDCVRDVNFSAVDPRLLERTVQ